MTPNFELLDQALAWAEASRDHKNLGEGLPRWDQSVWFHDPQSPEGDEYVLDNFCGTSCCIAGYVATRNGEKPLIEEYLDYAMVVRLKDGTVENIDFHARNLLGLTPEEATRLFEMENTLDDLRRIVAELKEAYGVDA